MSDYSLSDLAAASGNENGFGGANSWVLIILFALIFGWGGNGFGNNGDAASTADLQRAVDLNSIQEGQQAIRNDVQRTAYENMGTTKDAAYNNLSEIRDVQALISAGFANQQNCCCETLRAIDGVNYNLATQSAAIQSNDTANTQKILDMLTGNRMADMQKQINQLQLQNAVSGVVRYPNSYTYSTTSNPFCNCSSTTTTTTS